MAQFCMACGAELGERAKFCHKCGTARGAMPASSTTLPWVVAGIALLCLLGFIVGQNFRSAPAAVAPVAAGNPNPRGPDISQMSPQERADRLFNRVMTYVGAGQADSAQFFSPMAISAFEALAPLTIHNRYDLGLLAVASGDAAMARAQADTILASQPNHLLGLILGMRAAGLQLDQNARTTYANRFRAALVAERAKRLPEYVDHEPDIDAAVRDVDNRR